ncbi:MAG: GxGYxY sequence motif in domain of unknown function [Capsulimonas sp.]|nr:GxGYxY sequence motif in domain of unknown function [Capsulimonas sp.]
MWSERGKLAKSLVSWELLYGGLFGMKKRWPLTAVLLLSSTAFSAIGARAADPPASAPRAAVMLQTDMPVTDLLGRVSPRQIAADLTAAGVPTDLLDVSALADPAKLNIQNYAVVVTPYGNFFPKEAFANLRAFHQSGGGFVLTGIPFTHPVVRVKDSKGNWTWSDMGHDPNAALFGPDGIGVGGFAEPSGIDISVSPRDPLGLKDLFGPARPSSVQTLDPTTLPAEDQVIPILVSGTRPAAAMIVHHDAAFQGAVDIWTTHPDIGNRDAYFTEQMMERGVVAILAQKKLLSPERTAAVLTRIKNVAPPKQYTGLKLPTPPRPYETYQPRSSAPAEHLYVADVRQSASDERLLLSTLQGIVNRKQPRIYLIFRDSDEFWLQQLQAQGTTGAPIMTADPLSLLTTFQKDYKGAVVTDPNVYVSPHVAVDIAGLEDQIVASPDLAKKLNLKIKTDLRGKFKDDADAYRYVRTKLLRRLNPYLSISLDAPLDTGAIDQIVAGRGQALWVTGPREQDKPGANGRAELIEIEAIFAKMPLNSVVRGYWYAGDSNGIGEGPGVSLASRFGKVTIVSDNVSNFSVFSGAPAKTYKQTHKPAPTLDPTKVYVAVTISDGDNLCTWENNFQEYFNDPLHGTFPIGWGMGPTLLDVAPNMVQWYYDHATPNDEFFCDVSGIGYIYPPDWATALKDRDDALTSFFGWTAKYMDKLDLKTIRHMNVQPADIGEMGVHLPNTKFFVPDYGYAGEKGYDAMTYPLPTGQTVFRTVTGGNPREMAAQIKERVGDRRPAFVNAFIVNWGTHLGDIKKRLDELGPNYVAVTPSQLNELYLKARVTYSPAL